MENLEQALEETLFNDSTLSDVKIKQSKGDAVKEYHAHKAILRSQSNYFRKAFTGSFKEATSCEIELHEDDLDSFEYALKFIYTLHYDREDLGAGDKKKQLLALIGLYAIADKYDIFRLFAPLAVDFRTILTSLQDPNGHIITVVIGNYYDICAKFESEMGVILVSAILKKHQTVTKKDEFRALLKQYSVFSGDIAIYSSRQHLFDKVNIHKSRCTVCFACDFYDFSNMGDDQEIVRIQPYRIVTVKFVPGFLPMCSRRIRMQRFRGKEPPW
ncbi:hypothetical protein BDV96DRAFT_639561 [Lophiotrema nucula]|uniref:BTB domain-containing protein n=1 Tax=Lophiotrema nucula TaxID=690887 RepID=A0A6A5ZTM9_9PLEO|nr:hypothetical protein BDV96DRAFT_639561 [Lophiotrema nucula]